MGLGAADGSEFGYVLGSELGIAEGLFVSEMDGKVEIIKLGSVDCAVDGFSLFEAEGMVLGGCVEVVGELVVRIGNEDGLEVGLEFGFSVGVELVGCDEGSKLLCAVGMLGSYLENVGLRKGDLVRSFLGGDGDSLCFKLRFDEFMML